MHHPQHRILTRMADDSVIQEPGHRFLPGLQPSSHLKIVLLVVYKIKRRLASKYLLVSPHIRCSLFPCFHFVLFDYLLVLLSLLVEFLCFALNSTVSLLGLLHLV